MALDATVDERAADVDDPPVRRSRRIGLWAALALVCIASATALGIITSDEVRTNTQFDATHQSLDRTTVHIHSVITDLDAVRRDLSSLNVQVFLTTRALNEDVANLEAARAKLAGAQTDVTQQTTTITDLQTCLGGVQQALNALSVADQSRAINSLNSVASSCNEIVASSG